MRLACVLCALLLPALAHAEDRRFTVSLGTFAAGQAFDVWSTRVGLSRGCLEGNPLYGSARPSLGRMVAVKSVLLAPTVVAAVWLHKTGHPTAAQVLGYSGGGLGFGVGARNLLVCR